jgi:uncharacterized protein YbjQ (UPF0145 family)
MTDGHALFSSDLTVDELLLLEDVGWEPVAVVGGDSTFDPGSGARWYRERELTSVSNGLADGQMRAVDRMRTQAAAAGAHGVLGVRLRANPVHGLSAIHFAALGTAVRKRDTRLAKGASPFTSHLSGHDTWALLKAGCRPLGFVFGFCVYNTQFKRPPTRGVVEMENLTGALYTAREKAMSRMQRQAAALRAGGVVGVTIEMLNLSSQVIRFHASGTAIAPATDRPRLSPFPAIRLND